MFALLGSHHNTTRLPGTLRVEAILETKSRTHQTVSTDHGFWASIHVGSPSTAVVSEIGRGASWRLF